VSHDLLDPAEMTAEERDAEIAALFAAAALRLRSDRRARAPHPAPRGLVTPPLSKSRNRLDTRNGESPHAHG
jgi:hypothetical protein